MGKSRYIAGGLEDVGGASCFMLHFSVVLTAQVVLSICRILLNTASCVYMNERVTGIVSVWAVWSVWSVRSEF